MLEDMKNELRNRTAKVVAKNEDLRKSFPENLILSNFIYILFFYKSLIWLRI